MDTIKVNHMEKEFRTEISAEAIPVSKSWISVMKKYTFYPAVHPLAN